MKYVIIGNSTAAVGAVEAIRKTDSIGELVLISDEPHHTYARPLISYLLQGKVDEEAMKYRPDSFYRDNKCTLLLSKRAVKIEPGRKCVSLEDGTEVSYDKLLVAAGSAPFIPPLEGLDTVEKAFTFMDLENARKLNAALNEQARVLILGAGLIGLKCAEGIAKTVASVTIVDLAPTILSSILDPEGAAIVQAHLEENGLNFKLGQSVKRFSGNTAELTGGETVSFDALVLAVGVRPNSSLIKDAGGAVSRGIVTDFKMKTSLPDIYAAGDCTESYDCSSGRYTVLALLPNAYMQGECAGTNMAGGRMTWEKAIPMNAIGFFGLHMMTAGFYEGEVYFDRTEKNYKKLFHDTKRLKGFILIGKVDRAGIYTRLIREQTPLEELDFDLICKEPALMAFSKKDRVDLLGGGKA
jgi:NAD(P)H-nitrite reductase large subunit